MHPNHKANDTKVKVASYAPVASSIVLPVILLVGLVVVLIVNKALSGI